jgi:hypothetical protein
MDISSKAERCEIIGRWKWNTPTEIKFTSGYQEVNNIWHARKGGCCEGKTGSQQYRQVTSAILGVISQDRVGNILTPVATTFNRKQARAHCTPYEVERKKINSGIRQEGCKNIRPSARPHQQSN